MRKYRFYFKTLTVILWIAVLLPAFAGSPIVPNHFTIDGAPKLSPRQAPQEDISRLVARIDALTNEVGRLSIKITSAQRDDALKSWLTFLSPILAAALTAVAAYKIASNITGAHNRRQTKVQEIELVEKFMPHFEKGEESVRAALHALAGLDAQALVCHLAFVFASPQSVLGLEELLLVTDGKSDKIQIAKGLIKTLNVLVHQSFQSGNYILAEHWLRKLIHQHASINDKNRSEYANSLNDLASVLHKRGYLQDAEKTARQASGLLQAGEESNKVAKFKNTLGMICEELGQYDEAEKLIIEADKLCSDDWESMPDKISYRTNMATIFERKAQYSDAESRYREAINFYDQRFGPLSEKNGTFHGNLGLLYKIQGRAIEAEGELSRALDIRIRSVGLEHPDTLTALTNLADHHIDQRQVDDADKLIQQAQSIVAANFGEDSLHMALVVGLKGKICSLEGDINGAIAAENEALQITERAVGAEHSVVATRLLTLAGFHMRRNDYAPALPLLKRAYSISKATKGEASVQMSQVQLYLAHAYLKTGNPAEAKQLIQQSLQCIEACFGKSHPRYAQALNRLAGIHMSEGKPSDALIVLQQALEIQHDARRVGDISMANTMHNMGCAFFSKGQITEAVTWLDSSVVAYEKILGPDHPELLSPLVSRLDAAKALKNATDQAKYSERVEAIKAKFPEYFRS